MMIKLTLIAIPATFIYIACHAFLTGNQTAFVQAVGWLFLIWLVVVINWVTNRGGQQR